jgi:branched-chain amino acid transport system permease protein
MTMRRLSVHVAPLGIPIVIVTLISLVITRLGSPVLVSVLMAALINMALVVGVYVFNGNSGVFSFGQMAFMMVGAYAAALFSIPVALKKVLLPDLFPWVQQAQFGLVGSIVIGGVFAAIAAAVLGYPLMRMSGIQAGIATLALLLIAQNVASRWDSVTNGSKTLVGIPNDLTPYIALAFVLVMLVVAYSYQVSRFGLRLRAAREDELAATASGVRVSRERQIAFVLSAFICGVGGGMIAHFLGSLSSTSDSFFTPTFLVIAMLVIGGLYSLSGAVVGTIFVSVVVELLRQIQLGVSLGSVDITMPPGTDTVVLGLLLLVTLIFRPSGLTLSREFRWPRR